MKFKQGDRVAYAVKWLKSIGQVPTGELCHWRGNVEAVRTIGRKPNETTLVRVQWDNGETLNVAEPNLAKVGPNPRFANCE